MSSQTVRDLGATLSDELEQLTTELLSWRHDSNLSSAPVAVRERRLAVQERIRFLGALLAGIRGADPAHLDRNRAGLGSSARVRDLVTSEGLTFTIVPFDLADGTTDRVTPASPVGQAILGARKGDVVDIVTPAGIRRVVVEHVATIWDTLERRQS
jgi:transcription elongation GreA/GreB family factor